MELTLQNLTFIEHMAKYDFDIIKVNLRTMYVKQFEEMKIKKMNIFYYCVTLSVICHAMNITMFD